MISFLALVGVVVGVMPVPSVVLGDVAVNADGYSSVLHDEFLFPSVVKRPVSREEVHITQAH